MVAPPAVLICGIANERSLAAAAARILHRQGVPLLLTWQDERHRRRVEALAESVQAECIGRMDVCAEETLTALAAALADRPLAGLLHAIAFARLSDGDGEPIPVHQVDAARWAEAMEVSARSLPLLINTVLPQLVAGASVVTLTHHGARRVAPGYNMMGVAKAALEAAVRYCAVELGPQQIRVNAVSAGPVRTAAASAVPGFAQRLAAAAERNPLRRTVAAAEVGETVAWLLSPAASGISGAIIPVDAGQHLLD